MSQLQKKSFASSDETRNPPKAKIEVVKVGDETVMRVTFEPGWRWSDHLKPTAGTELCEVHHVGYQVSGKMGVRLPDGTEIEVQPGDVVNIPTGHDAWVVGDEPVVFVDFKGGATYSK